ncbi:MAG: hypothetical protein SGJ19_11555 [Planctomycetia bacterium]|nr:hypothetical protein [Planctomycetia bacterium]
MLEVLVSVFVLTVGILGLAALIPIGRFEVLEAGKLDRGATLGKIAFREVLLRDMLRETNWVAYDDSAQEYVYWPNYISNLNAQEASRIYSGPFVIDPAMLAEPRNRDYVFGGSNGVPSPATFPYNVALDASDAGLANVPRLPRLSLTDLMPYPEFDPANNLFRINPTTLSNSNLQRDKDSSLSDRIFRGHDDLSYVVADDQDARPTQQYTINSAANSEQFERQEVQARLNATSVGDYSWLVMASPAFNEVYDSSVGYKSGKVRTFDVSVVVFYKRPISLLPADDTEAPAERTVAITFGGSGVGGGSAHLSHPDPKYLRDLRPNQWLLVTGKLDTSTWPTTPPPPTQPPVVAKWYRIVSVDDGSGVTDPPSGEDPHRDVTLDGADWDMNRFVALASGPEGDSTSASIFDGVIAVYERTVRIDSLGN